MFETLRETCGLMMFMCGSLVRSAASLRAFATLAAVLPEKIGDGAKGLVVGRMESELSLAPNADEARIYEPIEVVVQGRPRNVEPLLQLGRGQPFPARLDHRPQQGKA